MYALIAPPADGNSRAIRKYYVLPIYPLLLLFTRTFKFNLISLLQLLFVDPTESNSLSSDFCMVYFAATLTKTKLNSLEGVSVLQSIFWLGGGGG